MNKYLYTLGQILTEDYPEKDLTSDDIISELIKGHIDEILWVLTILKLEIIYGIDIPDKLADRIDLTLEEFTDELSKLPLIADKSYPEFYDIKMKTLELSKRLIDLDGETGEESIRELDEINYLFGILGERLNILLARAQVN